MARIRFKGRLRRWGNTYGVRISPDQVKRLKANEGDELTFEASKQPLREDFSDVAVLHGPDPHGSRDHDRILGEAMHEEAKRWRRPA